MNSRKVCDTIVQSHLKGYEIATECEMFPQVANLNLPVVKIQQAN